MIDWHAPTRHKHPGTRRAVAGIAIFTAISLVVWLGVAALL